jgi:hypothetical protein
VWGDLPAGLGSAETGEALGACAFDPCFQAFAHLRQAIDRVWEVGCRDLQTFNVMVERMESHGLMRWIVIA